MFHVNVPRAWSAAAADAAGLVWCLSQSMALCRCHTYSSHWNNWSEVVRVTPPLTCHSRCCPARILLTSLPSAHQGTTCGFLQLVMWPAKQMHQRVVLWAHNCLPRLFGPSLEKKVSLSIYLSIHFHAAVNTVQCCCSHVLSCVVSHKISMLVFVSDLQALSGCRISPSNNSAAKSAHTNTWSHLQVRLPKTTEPRWTTAGRRAESAAVAFSESHLCWESNEEVQENTFDWLCIWQCLLLIEEELLCKNHVQKLRCQVAVPEDFTAQLKWPDDWQSQSEWPGSIRGRFESHTVALDVGDLHAGVQAAPVHWTLFIPVSDKTGAKYFSPTAIITSGVCHFPIGLC